jgi:hypothetical protein
MEPLTATHSRFTPHDNKPHSPSQHRAPTPLPRDSASWLHMLNCALRLAAHAELCFAAATQPLARQRLAWPMQLLEHVPFTKL